MFSALLLPLLAGVPAVTPYGDPPIQVWINNDRRFLPGDRAKVQVRTQEDGYLVVLHTDVDGHLRVLFPIDPTDDNFVRGGHKYEIRGRGGRESFTVDGAYGVGTVYAAVSRDPYHFDGMLLGDHWDYRALAPNRLPREPESELTELVRRMAQGSFDYDLLTYNVIERVVYADRYDGYDGGYYGSYYDSYYYDYPSRFSVSLFFGRPFYRRPFYYRTHYIYDPFYDPFFYDPFYYRPVYYPVRYYSYYPYYPYYGYYNYYQPYRNYAGYYQYPGTRYGRPFTPYRFRGFDGVGDNFRDRRYSFTRAVNTVYNRPVSRFAESERATPVRRVVDGRAIDQPGRVDSRREAMARPEARRETARQSDSRREAQARPEARRETTRQPDSRREAQVRPEARREVTREPEARRQVATRPEPMMERRPIEARRARGAELRREDLPSEVRPPSRDREDARLEARRAERETARESEPVGRGPAPEARRARPDDDRGQAEPVRGYRESDRSVERGGDRGQERRYSGGDGGGDRGGDRGGGGGGGGDRGSYRGNSGGGQAQSAPSDGGGRGGGRRR